MRSRPFDALGFDFAIESPDTELIAAFDDLLGDLSGATNSESTHLFDLRPTPTEEPRYDVTLDGESLYQSLVEDATVSHVLIEVNRRVATSCHQRGMIPLHAATVATVEGHAMVLAGASHSGKTTLATALAVTADAEHVVVADEVSALDPGALTIERYGKPVALRSSAVALLTPHVARFAVPHGRFERTERFVPPSQLGRPRAVADAPMPAPVVTTVVFPSFSPGSPPALVALRPSDALTRLMNLTLGEGTNTIRAFRALEQLVRQTDAYEITHSNALDAAELLRGFGCPR
jgi:energy-coupling factor transporter ATP-binding protein EcfA2